MKQFVNFISYKNHIFYLKRIKYQEWRSKFWRRKLREKINQLKKQIDPSEMNYMIPHNCKASCWLNKPNSRMKKKQNQTELLVAENNTSAISQIIKLLCLKISSPPKQALWPMGIWKVHDTKAQRCLLRSWHTYFKETLHISWSCVILQVHHID